ncbi:MAG: hypothetical protein GDA46_00200 [Bdellovibrionales bacterium]|nr:hypothetical protein [Bdellovibrionales bacterium]
MRLAGVDIGSNTSLLLIVEKTETGFEVLADEIYFTRLAENMEYSSKVSDSALARLEKAFQDIQKKLKSWDIKEYSIVATSAVRQAENKKNILDLANQYFLSPLQIISSQREAELTFIGSFFGLGQTCFNPLVIDIGGGSTEFVDSKKKYSLNIGTVSLTERFLSLKAISLSERKNLNEFILKKLQHLESFLKESHDKIIFTAGTPTTLALMETKTTDMNKIHGLILQREQVDFWLSKLSQLSVEERKKIPYLPEHRTDVIVAGLSLLNQILHLSEKTSFLVSVTGVRYGLILEKFQTQLNQTIKN